MKSDQGRYFMSPSGQYTGAHILIKAKDMHHMGTHTQTKLINISYTPSKDHIPSEPSSVQLPDGPA